MTRFERRDAMRMGQDCAPGLPAFPHGITA